MSKKHKNSNDVVGNFVIYAIWKNLMFWKFGKADEDRITKSSGLPTRLYQQIVKLTKLGFRIDFDILKRLKQVTTKEAKDTEQNLIDEYVLKYGQKPDGNIKII